MSRDPATPSNMTETSFDDPLNALSGSRLTDAVCKLYSLCSHTQQVVLMNELLPLYLKRDFISLLPPEIVVKILSYLEAGDIFRCLLVSRGWNKVITDSEPFWKYYTRLMGVPGEMMSAERHRYSSYKAFALAVLRVRNAIRKGKPTYRHYPDKTGKPPKATLTCRPAKPITNGLFISHEVYAGCDIGTYILSLRAVDRVNDLVELTAVTVSHLFVIIWSQSSPNYILIHGSDGSWIQSRILSRDGFDVRNSTWNDRVYSGAYYELGCCPDCCLLGIVSKVARENELWDLLVTRLVTDTDEPEKLHTTFSFLPFKPSHRNVFFQIHKLAILPDSSQRDVEGFCTKHKLLLQFGACICIFSLDIQVEADGMANVIVENLCNLCPFDDLSYYSTPSILGHHFCLSTNNKFAAYFVDGSFYSWNLETLKLYGFRKKGYDFPKNADCIAVGSLFSIMYTTGIRGLRVISTVNGETLLVHRIDYTGDNPVHGPKDQRWLSDLNVRGMSMPLAITLQEWQNPGLLYFRSPNAYEV